MVRFSTKFCIINGVVRSIKFDPNFTLNGVRLLTCRLVNALLSKNITLAVIYLRASFDSFCTHDASVKANMITIAASREASGNNKNPRPEMSWCKFIQTNNATISIAGTQIIKQGRILSMTNELNHFSNIWMEQYNRIQSSLSDGFRMVEVCLKIWKHKHVAHFKR